MQSDDQDIDRHEPEQGRAVGAGRVDHFGFEHARLTLNGLDYRPRPMGGGPFKLEASVQAYPWKDGHDGAGAFLLKRSS